MKHLIAIDWGTSSLRGALLAGDGTVLEEVSAPAGILVVPAGGFAGVFAQHFGRWQQATGALALIAGMAGSKQGWQEAPYCACPAGFADIASRLHWIEPARIALVPGLSCEDHGVPDVMRGEETQVFGALALLGLADARMVLPGTHSKWVQVAQGRIVGFRTFMTGELYALLRQHSILARTLPQEDGQLDADAFRRGLAHARASASLLHAAFSVRTLALFDRLPASAMPSYLSGLVIGDELRAQALDDSRGPVVVVGAPALAARYRLALEALGIAAATVGAQASWSGLFAIARHLEQSP
ncbi:2-dehydro-3-deoxygalactonokinase [Caenimonas terrae]|uniref:2-dehydro-3-deoxygalactonokinase n=1 Tax=Caenimonas terrae TaxID=696074 RepID=A0ABW0NEM8_9BURK